MPREQVGTILIADTQHIAEARGRDEERRTALALKQRVCRDGRADAQFGDGVVGQFAFNAEKVADTLRDGVGVASGIFGEQFARDDFAAGRPRDKIGEGAASVGPDFPAARH